MLCWLAFSWALVKGLRNSIVAQLASLPAEKLQLVTVGIVNLHGQKAVRARTDASAACSCRDRWLLLPRRACFRSSDLMVFDSFYVSFLLIKLDILG